MITKSLCFVKRHLKIFQVMIDNVAARQTHSMMIDNRDETLALQEAYANIYNEIVKAGRIFVVTHYFRRKWLPLLGSSLAWVII